MPPLAAAGAGSSNDPPGGDGPEEHAGDTRGSEAHCEKGLPDPGQPTAAMIEEHNSTHLPYRSWCPACVRGRGRSIGHKTGLDHSQDRVPVLAFDYLVDANQTVLVMVDRRTKCHWSIAVPSKGTGDPYPVKALVKALDSTGYREVILKSDQEPSCVALTDAAKTEWRCGHIIPEYALGAVGTRPSRPMARLNGQCNPSKRWLVLFVRALG